MSDIQPFVALEMFTHPDDLDFTLIQGSCMWGFIISKMEGNDKKILMTKPPTLASPEAAIEVIRHLLDDVGTSMKQKMGNPKSVISRILHSAEQPLYDENVFSEQYRRRICRELTQHHSTGTYTYKQEQIA